VVPLLTVRTRSGYRDDVNTSKIERKFQLGFWYAAGTPGRRSSA
jgi:hypothetical protein